MFIPGDLIFFAQVQHGEEVQTGGIVIALDDGLVTVALPHGVELVNMRSALFARAWLVEHAPREMSADEALAFSRDRLAQLRQARLVLVHPDDERAPAADRAHASH